MPSGLVSARAGRPARRTLTAAQGFSRHRLEALASKRALLLEVLANGDRLVIAYALLEPRSIGFGAHQWRSPHLNETGVGCHQRVFAKCQVGMHAGPVVMLGLLDHRGTNGVELDIPIRGEQVAVRVDETGFEASFPQGSAASMAAVECCDVRLSQLTHGQRHLSRFVGTDEQVHVIAYQHVGVDAQTVADGALAQQAQIVATIVVIQKDGAAIDPALSDVERYAGDLQASLAGHEHTEWSGSPVSVRRVARGFGNAGCVARAMDRLSCRLTSSVPVSGFRVVVAVALADVALSSARPMGAFSGEIDCRRRPPSVRLLGVE